MKIFSPWEQNAARVLSNSNNYLIVVTPGWLVLRSLLIRREPVSYKVSSDITWSSRSLSHVFTHSSWTIMSTWHLLTSRSLVLASILKTLSLKLLESFSFAISTWIFSWAISYMNLQCSTWASLTVSWLTVLPKVTCLFSIPKGDKYQEILGDSSPWNPQCVRPLGLTMKCREYLSHLLLVTIPHQGTNQDCVWLVLKSL